jgi:hypothetical protein
MWVFVCSGLFSLEEKKGFRLVLVKCQSVKVKSEEERENIATK